MTQGFGADARLSAERFSARLHRGTQDRGSTIIVRSIGSASGGPLARLGLSVSGKVGKRLRRNRLKRLPREAFPPQPEHLRPGCDVVVYLRPGVGWPGLADAEKDLLDLCRKAGILQ